MKFFLPVVLLSVCSLFSKAQCPTISGIMINSCGSTEEFSEFVVIKNGSSVTTASNIKLSLPNGGNQNYGSLASATTIVNTFDAGITNAACKSSGATPILIPATGSTSIPANANILYFTGGPSTDGSAYNFNAYCGQTFYVLVASATPLGGGRFSNAAPRTTTISTTGCAGSSFSYTYPVPFNAPCGTGASQGPGCSSTGDGDYVSFHAPDSPTQPVGNNNSSGSNADGYINPVAVMSNNGCAMPPPPIVLATSFIKIAANRLNNANYIKWQTGEETNIKEFVVERSFDGAFFNTIATQTPAGNNSLYNYTDHTAGKSTAYYRITVKDIDGSKKTSGIAVVAAERSSATLTCYPIPAKDILNIDWTTGVNTFAMVSIIDITGRTVSTKNITAVAGSNRLSLNVSSLAAGQYFVKINGDTKLTAVFIKK